MRIAAIDIGTNSIHMIVVQIRPDFSFEVIDREKEMVRLGAGGLDGRALTPEAMHAALQVLSKFRRLAESHRVDDVIAVATSAVREAENGGEFLKTVTSQTGIRPRVISGTEEARLIHSAAVYGVSVPRDVAVVIDIGGGSAGVTRRAGAAPGTWFRSTATNACAYPVSSRAAPISRSAARFCSTSCCADWAPTKSHCVICHCVKVWCSITSPGTARRSRKRIGIRTSGGAACTSWPNGATTGRSMRNRSRASRLHCSIKRVRFTV